MPLSAFSQSTELGLQVTPLLPDKSNDHRQPVSLTLCTDALPLAYTMRACMVWHGTPFTIPRLIQSNEHGLSSR